MTVNSEERNLLRRYFGAGGHAKRRPCGHAADTGGAADDGSTTGTRRTNDTPS